MFDDNDNNDSNNESFDRMAILTEITDLAASIGWYVALPPEQVTTGIFLGTQEFINQYNDLVPLENQVEILDETLDSYGKQMVH